MTHLVVIVADTLREPRGLPGCDPTRTMPFLTGLAARGQVHRNFVASAPWTIPSHVSLLTGREPWSVVYTGRAGLRIPDGPSLADAWRAATGGVSVVWSANGLVGPLFRTTPGYDACNVGSSRLWACRQSARLWSPLRGPVIAANGIAPPARWFRPGDRGPAHNGSTLRRGFYRAAGSTLYTCTSAMLSGEGPRTGLEHFLRRRTGRRPLHVLLNLMETHEPYALPPAPDPSRLPPWIGLPMSSLSSFQSRLRPYGEVPGLMRPAYVATLGRLDDRLRGIFGALERGGVLQDALVVLVSDHGQSLGEEGRYGHGNSLADELVRVPCIVWRFREGKARGPTSEPSRPFDHRHLHDALARFATAPEQHDLTPWLGEALEARGPAMAFQEGSPSTLGVRSRKEGADVPIVRAVRVMDGTRDQTLELEEANGRLRLRPDAEARVTGGIRDLLPPLLLKGRSWTGSAEDRGVDQRLSAWGYV